MFGALKKLVANAAKIDEDKLIQNALTSSDIEKQIIKLNQDQLYNQGIQSDGTPTGDYAPLTKFLKVEYGDAYGIPGKIDHVTGLNTGVTYDSMEVVSQSNGIVIEADNNGFFDKEKKALGLTDESISKIIPPVREKIIQEFKKELFA